MKKGWWNAGKSGSEKWYYFKDSKGTPASGWMKINKKWYYFAPKKLTSAKQGYKFSKNTMVYDCTLKIGGKKYKFNSKGVCTNP